MYSANRRLDKEEREVLKQILPLNPSAQRLKEYCHSTFNKPVTLKDVHNLRAHMKGAKASVDALCDLIQEITDNGGQVAAYLDEADNCLDLLCFAPKDLLVLYKQYPEIIFMDGTYKVIALWIARTFNLLFPFYFRSINMASLYTISWCKT
jgi:hypothetical protein